MQREENGNGMLLLPPAAHPYRGNEDAAARLECTWALVKKGRRLLKKK